MSARIERQKERCRKLMQKYNRRIEHLDCGNALAQHIVPEASELARKFDVEYAKLREMDPAAPAQPPLYASGR